MSAGWMTRAMLPAAGAAMLSMLAYVPAGADNPKPKSKQRLDNFQIQTLMSDVNAAEAKAGKKAGKKRAK